MILVFAFDGFTEKSNQAMNLAVEKAQELGHGYIGSEHVLYGLLAEGSGVAFQVLNSNGVKADAFEKMMREKLGIA